VAADFHVAVTRDLRQEDGTFLFAPATDLTPLDEAERVSWRYLDSETIGAGDLAQVDALLHLSPALPAEALDDAWRLVLVARSGVGLDAIDIDACTRHGVAVTITPEPVARSMASAAMALLLALSHRLVERHESFRSGDWDAGRNGLIGVGLRGRTLGLVGFGRIARELRRLVEPFEMTVCAHTPRLTEAEAARAGVEACELDELLRRSDFVVVACPLTDETRGLVSEERLALMKPGAFLVNVARGPIVDERALARALAAGAIAGAGLDVFETEPLPPGSAIAQAPHVIGAPHSLGFTDQLLQGCIGSACEAILDVARGVVPKHFANPEVVDDPAFRRKLAAASTIRTGSRR
jgi:D-3-phosphoglycerate dehydrogenase